MTGLPEKQKEKEVCEAKWLSNFFFPLWCPSEVTLPAPHESAEAELLAKASLFALNIHV